MERAKISDGGAFMHNRFAHSYFLAGLLIGSFGLAHAQDVPNPNAPPPPPSFGPGVAVVQQGSATGMGFQFVSGEPAISMQGAQNVTGAPYSLDATIESAQTLTDGNRIVHRQTVHLYRDSKGRTRREETLAAIGPWAASGTPPTMITIQDPVSGVSYFLDPQRKTATKLPVAPTGKGVFVTGGMGGEDAGDGQVTASVSSDHIAKTGKRVMVTGGMARGDEREGPVVAGVFGSAAGGFASADEGRNAVITFNAAPSARSWQPEHKSESLGTESISGLTADGTRITMTIPANAIGNERPVEIVRERWYSQDLQIVLRSTQSDPRFGTTSYEVTTITRKEPSASVFTVPSDYKVSDAEPPILINNSGEAK
jgi:hypothetical protein